MYIKLIDSISDVQKKVNLALSEEINKSVRKKITTLKLDIQSFVSNSVMNQPEMISLVGGYLRGAFGLVSPESAVVAITTAVVSSISVNFKPYDARLKGGITINVQPSDFLNLLSLPDGHLIYKKGDLHWLRWLLEYGDTIIVANYEYNPQVGIGRSSLGNMEDGSGFRVPPQFSGTLSNNFITRALTNPEAEKYIFNLLKKVLM